MNKTAKRIIGLVLTVLLLLGMLSMLSGLTSRKEGKNSYMPFFQCADTVDVLFFGTSHMFDAVYPMELWADYGITSYNCAMAAATIPTSYWEFVNTLDYAQPKLIVLDCYGIGFEGLHSGYSYIASFFEALPFSANKLRAIQDFRQENLSSKETVSLLWPFCNYHNRWEELSAADFIQEYSVEKGAQHVINVAVPDPVCATNKKMQLSVDMPGVEYLEKIIEKCRERGVQLLLTYLPFPSSEEKRMEANAVYDLAEEYGVNYINFMDEDVVDFDTDMFDPYSHLNSSGAEKITAYLGSYITENYNIADRRNDPACAAWHEDLAVYNEYKFQLLEEQQYLFTTLMLLRNNNYSSLIVLEKGSAVFEDPMCVALLRNAAWGAELPGLSQAAETGEKYMLLIDNAGKTVQEFCGEQELEAVDTGLGTLNFSGQGASLNGKAILPPSGAESIDAQCFIFDNSDPEARNIGRSYTADSDGTILRNY